MPARGQRRLVHVRRAARVEPRIEHLKPRVVLPRPPSLPPVHGRARADAVHAGRVGLLRARRGVRRVPRRRPRRAVRDVPRAQPAPARGPRPRSACRSFTNTGTESHSIVTCRLPEGVAYDALYDAVKERGIIALRLQGRARRSVPADREHGRPARRRDRRLPRSCSPTRFGRLRAAATVVKPVAKPVDRAAERRRAG